MSIHLKSVKTSDSTLSLFCALYEFSTPCESSWYNFDFQFWPLSLQFPNNVSARNLTNIIVVLFNPQLIEGLPNFYSNITISLKHILEHLREFPEISDS